MQIFPIPVNQRDRKSGGWFEPKIDTPSTSFDFTTALRDYESKLGKKVWKNVEVDENVAVGFWDKMGQRLDSITQRKKTANYTPSCFLKTSFF